jgi:predicted Ser/Thr protein kinase
MDPGRWRQIQDIYTRAVELTPEERSAFIRHACGDDGALMEAVQSMLAWHSQMSGVLEQGAMQAAAGMGYSDSEIKTASVGVPPAASIAPIARSGNAGVGRLASSDSIPVGGFTPGAILSDRYRIIGLIGRGGMGEVYRADDLKLGQPVALKFLPREFSSDPVRRERFFAEVRITRQLSHPNICRVYDVGEFEGQHFLSMEYIDGEDLQSLLKRIGYLSNEKAIDVARQFLSGLAAAHERGVLHRDLKPANIMIDGRGRVRITDFGIAIAAGEDTQERVVAGTPAYMAPEQLRGRSATVQSDIYALGLVLYEIYSGKKAFSAATLAELREQKEHETPRPPSEIRPGMDPVVEGVILRCIEREPRDRPVSIAKILVALPGGDPLAAALAAGETPSPEMVAASSLKEGLRPAVAVGIVIAIILGSIAIVLMNPRTSLLMRGPTGKDPRVLADRAQEFIKKAGYTYSAADTASGLAYDRAYVLYLHDSDKTPNRWDRLADYGAVEFWFRQSARRLERSPGGFDFDGDGVTSDNPALQFSGDVVVSLDLEGRLREFQAIPPQTRSAGENSAATDWNMLFAEANLDPAQWTPAEPQWNPNQFADSVAAWTGTLPGIGVPARIEAAAYGGKPVSFQIIGPWTRPKREAEPLPLQAAFVVITVATLSGIFFGLYLARKNLRRGRGDRRGAKRLAILAIVGSTLSWVFNEHHLASTRELVLFAENAAGALLKGGAIWIMYIALEPSVRRRQTAVLVSWSRALAGQWRDPLLGRDVLAGCLMGVLMTCLGRFLTVAPAWFGYPEGPLLERDAGYLFATGVSPTKLFDGVGFGAADALIAVLLFVFLQVVFRSERIAAVVWILVVAAGGLTGSEAPLVFLPVVIIAAALGLWAILRFGMISAAVATSVNYFWYYPITFQRSAWYSSLGYPALAVLAALVFYGFYTSLGGQRGSLFSKADDLPGDLQS